MPGFATTLVRTRKQRPTVELVCELVFRPAAELLVAVLRPLGVTPVAVVLAHFAAGLAAAVLVAEGNLVAAAVLLQAKTLLDNADGQLARATGKVTALGRYLDTECDLLVNVALVAAICVRAGGAGTAVLGVVALPLLMLVLSADFGLERLWRREHGPGERDDAPATGLARVLEQLYDRVLGVQDRLVERVVEARLARLCAGVDDPQLRREIRAAYHDRGTLSLLVNLGLSTQLAVLGVLLAVGRPELWLWLAVGCAALLPLLFARRELLALAVRRRGPGAVQGAPA